MSLVIAVRILSPLTILINPLAGTFFAAYTDIIDWEFLHFIDQFDPVQYQTVDKFLDFYYLLVIAYVMEKWKTGTAKTVGRFLFLWRGVGLVLFELFGKRELLILFPNFVDIFFVIYYAYPYFRKTALNYSVRNIFYIFLFFGVPKLIQEFLLHYNR